MNTVKMFRVTIISFNFVISFLLRDVRQMLLKLVELRSSDWGRVSAAAVSNATPENDPNYFMVSVRCTVSFSILFSLLPVSVFQVVMAFFFFLPRSQNEPTFYTEDGTPFTAADPGEHIF